MLTSVIVSVLVLATGVFLSNGRRPPWGFQPATVVALCGGSIRRVTHAGVFWSASVEDDDDVNILMDSLRAIGLVRRRVERPVVGRKAYVRLWERVRAIIVLSAIIVGLGVALATVIGVIVLGLGFLLEQAIS